MSYKPDQRHVPCQIMLSAGWVEGTFHVPRISKFVDQLNAQAEFLRVTDLSFVGKTSTVPFMSLQKNKTILIVPPPQEKDLSNEPEDLIFRRIFVLFEGGVLAGTLRIRHGVRTSDYFAKQQGFIPLRHCILRLGDLNEEFFVEERHPAVVINASEIIGVSEHDPFSTDGEDSPQ